MSKALTKEVQRRILIEIGDLIHENCRECGFNNNQRYCKSKCEIGKQLIEKGVTLDGGPEKQRGYNKEVQQKRPREERIQIFRKFLDLRMQGLSHAAARKEVVVANETLYNWVEDFGDMFPETPIFFRKQGKHLADDQQIKTIGKYLELRKAGSTHLQASEELGIKKDRMYTFLRKWGHMYPETEQFYKYNPR